MVEAQALYYSGDWVKAENNFNLQTLLGSLTTELGHGNTKGCKSNNDRGQRLVQKIAGNAFLTSQSETGLFTGDYFKLSTDKAKDIDKQSLVSQTMHHTASTSAGGGKFEMRDKANFTDNSLLGKVAKNVKLDSLGQQGPLKSMFKTIKDVTKGPMQAIKAVATVISVLTIVPGLAILGFKLATNEYNESQVKSKSQALVQAASKERGSSEPTLSSTQSCLDQLGENQTSLTSSTLPSLISSPLPPPKANNAAATVTSKEPTPTTPSGPKPSF